MANDLVKDLREYRVGCGLHCDSSDAGEPLAECLQAADRIEALEAALREIEREITYEHCSRGKLRELARAALNGTGASNGEKA